MTCNCVTAPDYAEKGACGDCCSCKDSEIQRLKEEIETMKCEINDLNDEISSLEEEVSTLSE